jgi:hypothetical protein
MSAGPFKARVDELVAELDADGFVAVVEPVADAAVVDLAAVLPLPPQPMTAIALAAMTR